MIHSSFLKIPHTFCLHRILFFSRHNDTLMKVLAQIQGVQTVTAILVNVNTHDILTKIARNFFPKILVIICQFDRIAMTSLKIALLGQTFSQWEIISQTGKNVYQLSERLTPPDIMGTQLRATIKPLGTIVMWRSRGFRGPSEEPTWCWYTYC